MPGFITGYRLITPYGWYNDLQSLLEACDIDESILRTVQRLRDRLGHDKTLPPVTNLRGTMLLIAPRHPEDIPIPLHFKNITEFLEIDASYAHNAANSWLKCDPSRITRFSPMLAAIANSSTVGMA